MAIEGLPLGGVEVDVFASQEAMARALTALPQGRYLLTGMEFNSLVVTLATAMDFIADPVNSQKNGGVKYVVERFFGPKDVFTDYNGKDDVSVVGVFAAPTEGDAKIWWDALAECMVRLGACRLTEGTVDQPRNAFSLVELVGLATRAAVPQNQLTLKSQLKVHPDLARCIMQVFIGGASFANRMVQKSRGVDIATSPQETDNKATAVAMADLWTKNAKMGLGYAAAGTAVLAVGAGIGVVVKRY